MAGDQKLKVKCWHCFHLLIVASYVVLCTKELTPGNVTSSGLLSKASANKTFSWKIASMLYRLKFTQFNQGSDLPLGTCMSTKQTTNEARLMNVSNYEIWYILAQKYLVKCCGFINTLKYMTWCLFMFVKLCARHVCMPVQVSVPWFIFVLANELVLVFYACVLVHVYVCTCSWMWYLLGSTSNAQLCIGFDDLELWNQSHILT